MTTTALLALALAAPIVAPWPPLPEGPPAALTNARVSVRRLAGSLADEVRGVGAGPTWIGYAVPSLQHGHMCCYDSVHESRVRPCGLCRLEGRGEGVNIEGSPKPKTTRGANAPPLAVVMLRVERGQTLRLGVYSDDCGLDAGGLAVLWLSEVPAAQSLAVLEALAAAAPMDEALAAIAAHQDPAADLALERLVAPRRPSKLREQAAFWIGQSRGRRGYEALRRLVREDKDPDFREHAVFALSESDVPEALDTIIEVARTNRNLAVREQAFFWLGQAEDPRALDFLAEVLKRP